MRMWYSLIQLSECHTIQFFNQREQISLKYFTILCAELVSCGINAYLKVSQMVQGKNAYFHAKYFWIHAQLFQNTDISRTFWRLPYDLILFMHFIYTKEKERNWPKAGQVQSKESRAQWVSHRRGMRPTTWITICLPRCILMGIKNTVTLLQYGM